MHRRLSISNGNHVFHIYAILCRYKIKIILMFALHSVSDLWIILVSAVECVVQWITKLQSYSTVVMATCSELHTTNHVTVYKQKVHNIIRKKGSHKRSGWRFLKLLFSRQICVCVLINVITALLGPFWIRIAVQLETTHKVDWAVDYTEFRRTSLFS
jgi:hypothetical protein